MKKIEFFKVEGDKIKRIRKHCPKCGPGVFIAEHKDRVSCGQCGYTEFKSGGKKEQNNKPQDNLPSEKPKKEETTSESKQHEEEPKTVEEPKSEEKEENKKE